MQTTLTNLKQQSNSPNLYTISWGDNNDVTIDSSNFVEKGVPLTKEIIVDSFVNMFNAFNDTYVLTKTSSNSFTWTNAS